MSSVSNYFISRNIASQVLSAFQDKALEIEINFCEGHEAELSNAISSSKLQVGFFENV